MSHTYDTSLSIPPDKPPPALPQANDELTIPQAVGELAILTGRPIISYRWLWDRVLRGEIPSTQHGRQRRIQRGCLPMVAAMRGVPLPASVAEAST